MRRLAVLAAAVLVVASGASAQGSTVLLGITGNVDNFKHLTGQVSVVHQAFLGWGQGESYGSPFRDLLPLFGPVPMLHLGTAARPPSKTEAITPAAIAAGQGDSYLIALNTAIGEWAKPIYIRPMAEMNNPVNLYSYEHKHDAAHSPAAYKSAFCRIFVILHGGTAAQVDAQLRRFGLNPVGRDLGVNPYPGVLRVIWNPLAGIEQGADPAARYFPGDACVDMIGNDMFSSSVGGGSFEENQALYDAHSNKPYSLPEWGLEGVDEPGFVQRICAFVKSHRRTQLASYYESKPGSIYDLGDKPQSRAVYRACMTPLGVPVNPETRPPPAGRENVVATGTVLIKVRGKFVPLSGFKQVPLGTELDATNGKVKLTSHDSSSGFFYQGRFRLTQETDKPGNGQKARKVTVLGLTGGTFKDCPAPSRSTAGAAKPRPKGTSKRHVWGNGKGAFRTKGRFASATVRGTLWRTDDFCNGTLITVKRGKVDVFDLRKHKHVLVLAGRSYLVLR
jgi:hypothetical protein